MSQTIQQEELVKIQPRGLLTIPIKFRQESAFKENSLVRLIKEKGRLVIEPVRTIPYPVRSYSNKEVKEFFDLDKKESKKLEKTGLI